MDTITFKYVDNLCIVRLDDIDYAVIEDCQRDDINESKVINWVNETSYDGDYLSTAYSPCYLRRKDFAA